MLHEIVRSNQLLRSAADLQHHDLPSRMVKSSAGALAQRSPLKLDLSGLILQPPPGLSLELEVPFDSALTPACGLGHGADASECSTTDPSTAEPSEAASSVPGTPCRSRQITPEAHFFEGDVASTASESEGSPQVLRAVSPANRWAESPALQSAGSTYIPGRALRRAIRGLPEASAVRASAVPTARHQESAPLRPAESATGKLVAAQAATSAAFKHSVALRRPHSSTGLGLAEPPIMPAAAPPPSAMVPPPPPPPGLSAAAAISIGSAGHGLGQCRPCDFTFRAGGCRQGAACQFCHLCGPEALKLYKKQRKQQVRQTRRDQAAAEDM